MTDQSELNSTTTGDDMRRLVDPVSDRLRTLPVHIGFRGQNLGVQPDDKVQLVDFLMQRWWLLSGCWVTFHNEEVYATSRKTIGYYTRLPGGENELTGAVRLALDGLMYLRGDDEVPREWHPSQSEAKDAMNVIKSAAPTDPDFKPGRWMLDGEYEWTSEWLSERYGTDIAAELRFDGDNTLIACHGGIIWVRGEERCIVLPHTPGFFTTSAVDCDYDPNADDGWGGEGEPTRWLKFLDEVFPNDPDAVMSLQEWFGYVLSGRTDLQKLLYIVGPKRSGKGTIIRILERLLGVRDRKSGRGNDRVASTTPQDLRDNFGLEDAIGKPLMVIPDARFAQQDAVTLQRVLSIVGEDTVRVNRKGLKAISMQLPCRVVFAANSLSDIRDDSGALAERTIVIETPVSFAGREDETLDQQLEVELTGILHWALQGAARLSHKGARFTMGLRSQELLDEMKDMMSPVRQFIRECCVLEMGAVTSKEELGQAWGAWVDESDVDVKSSKQALKKMIDKSYSVIKDGSLTPRQAADRGLPRKQMKVWFNVRLLRPEELPESW